MTFLQNINQNYASVLSLVVSIITALITAVYVSFTYNQMKATRTSVDMMHKQMLLDKQPCIIPEIKQATSGPAQPNGHRSLYVEINLRNIGTFSAISVITVGYLKLQQIKTKQSSDIVDISDPVYSLPCMEVNSNYDAHISFTDEEINYLVKDLEVAHNSKSDSNRTFLILKTYYRNILGQWFESKISKEILCIFDNNAPSGSNKNTIPPLSLTSTKAITIVFSRYSSLKINPVTEHSVYDQLKKYKGISPELFENQQVK